MINKISKLKKVGIYNFEDVDYDEFLKYNMFYGWNGSGKSTLSRLFSYIGGKEISDDFADLEADVIVDGKRYSAKKFNEIDEQIKVFNEDFIKENIDWNGVVKSILLFSEDTINESIDYKDLTKEVYGEDGEGGLKKENEERKKQQKFADNQMNDALTKTAKEVKDYFVSFNYKLDSKYLNYNKASLKRTMENKQITDDDILNENDRIMYISEIQSPKKDKLNHIKIQQPLENVSIKLNNIERILSEHIVANVIKELKNDTERSKWVKEGLLIHRKRESSNCLFCGNQLSNDTLAKLENHFNDSVSKLNERINQSINSMNGLKDDVLNNLNLDMSNLHPSLVENYKKISVKIIENNELIVEKIVEITKCLDKKQQNPFLDINIDSEKQSIIDLFEHNKENIDEINNIINTNNSFIDEYEKRIALYASKMERHIIAESLIKFQYESYKLQYASITKQIDDNQKIIDEKEEEIQKLESTLSREQVGAKEFNDELSKILGYDEITLKFNEEKKGYEIVRKGTVAKRLSEGEKTAIAFIYFMIKLKEQDDLSKVIVVIDDPISSFDSNKMFHTYSYIKNDLNDVEQLFLLTHNYSFFSMFHEWLTSRKKRDQNGNKINDWRKYRIDNIIDENGDRYAVINNGGYALNQPSEYDYLFQTLYRYKDKTLKEEEMLLCANLCRKLLESFLSFKFPKHRDNFKELLNAALPSDPHRVDKIYKYVNKLSHSKHIDVMESSDLNLFLDNDKDMVSDIFELLNELDSTHYLNMEEKAKEYFS